MEYSVIILLLPLCMFLFLGLVGHKLSERVAGILGTIGLSVAAVLAYVVAFNYFTMPRNAEGVFDTLQPINFEWLRFTEHLHIDLGILLDPISVMMLVVITTVSLMVHIYSMGYMHGEKGFQRYYAFLSLFSFSMLGLVVATNIFQMYIFWELVGVSSYLLIGFYYTKPAAVSASKKAFIVTRFADLGFLIGILILSFFTETFDFATLMMVPVILFILELRITNFSLSKSIFLLLSNTSWYFSIVSCFFSSSCWRFVKSVRSRELTITRVIFPESSKIGIPVANTFLPFFTV